MNNFLQARFDLLYGSADRYNVPFRAKTSSSAFGEHREDFSNNRLPLKTELIRQKAGNSSECKAPVRAELYDKIVSGIGITRRNNITLLSAAR